MVTIIDYDAGNMGSVEKAVRYLGEEVRITRKPEEILGSERVILPGVGSFGDAMEKLNGYGLTEVIREYAGMGKPFLGICLGLQLFFEESEESPGVKGLSLLPGRIRRIPDGEGRKVPHIGWNDLTIRPGTRLFQGVPDGSYVYFVHSYYLDAGVKEQVAARTEYGVQIDAAVEAGNLFACQFHPEKSSDTGLRILKNFISMS